MTTTPLAYQAECRGIDVMKTDDVNEASFVQRMEALRADAAVVVAFGQKLSPSLIAALGRLVVNLHGSLLPKYRGAAPINWAMINGEKQTGLSVISISPRIDAGLVYAHVSTDIDAGETAGELHDRLALMGAPLIRKVLGDLGAGRLVGRPQDESAVTRAPKLSKADGWVRFDVPADQVCRRIHGLTPWPGICVSWKRKDDENAQPLLLRRVAAEETSIVAPPPGTMLDGQRVAAQPGTIRLLEVQLPGKRPMSMEQFARGHRLGAGDTLGQ